MELRKPRSCALAPMVARSGQRMDFFRWRERGRALTTTPSPTSSTPMGKGRTRITPMLYKAATWARNSNSRTGVEGEWDFNGQRLLLPDPEQRTRANDFLAGADLLISAPARWHHRLTGYEYNHRRLNEDDTADQSGFPNGGCDNTNFFFYDCPFMNIAHINRAGFQYQGDYTPRSWAQTAIGYEFEDENGRFFTDSKSFNPFMEFTQHISGLRLNHSVFLQEHMTWKRFSATAGVRYMHSGTSSSVVPEVGRTSKVVPRVALTLLAVKGGEIFSGTRLRFSYASGIKDARFEELFVSE